MKEEFNCEKCGYCCRHLYLIDKIKISWHTKTIMLNKRCNFLKGNNECKIYNKKPKVCNKWYRKELMK